MRSFLGGWFDSAAIQAALGFDGVVGNFASPDTPGSAYVLLHHTFGEVNGKKGIWGHAIGVAWGRSLRPWPAPVGAAGVEILRSTPRWLKCVHIETGKKGPKAVAGVQLVDGRADHGR